MSALTAEAVTGTVTPQIPAFLELEITQFCQLSCIH